MAETLEIQIQLKLDQLTQALKRVESQAGNSGAEMGRDMSNNLTKTVDGNKAGQKVAKELAAEGGRAGIDFGKLFGAQLLANLASSGIQAAIGGIFGGALKGLDVAKNTESLKSSLLTTFDGVSELADEAFKSISKFANETPFQVEEVMGAFIKLKNMGLTPSEEALAAYGDTASAMGKDLNSMVEAVADAATGEFERLKEFGIRSSAEGDKVKFTFKGVTTEVGKNSAEIEKYLINLGKTNFGGGMARQAKTMGGLLSTLSDEFGKFTNLVMGIDGAGNIKEGGIFDTIKNGVSGALDFLSQNGSKVAGLIEGVFTKIIAAGKLVGDILFKGDFQGNMFGIEEDSPIVDVLFRIREGVVNLVDAAKLLFTGDFQGGMFGGAEEDSGIVDFLLRVRETAVSLIDTAKLLFTGNFQSGMFGGVEEDDPIVDKILTIREAIVSFVQFATANIGLIGAAFAGLQLGGFVAGLVGTFTTLSTSITAAGGIATIFAGVMAAVFSPITLLIAGIGLAVAGLYLAWQTNFGGIQQIAQNVFQTVLLPAFQQLLGAFSGLLPALQGLWNALAPTLLPVLQTLGIILAGAVVAGILIFAKTIELGVHALTGFVKWLTDAVNWVKDFASKVASDFQAFWSNVQAIWNAGVEIVKQIWTNVWDTIKAYLGAIFLSIVAIFTGNTDQLGTIWGAFGEKLKSIWSGMWEAVKAKWNETWTWITDQFNNLVNTATGKSTEAGEGMKQGIDNGINFLRNIDLAQVGKDMIQGLINGISSMASSVATTMSNLASNAVKAAKSALEIKSPSRVMMEIGVFTGQGMVAGMENSFSTVAKAGAALGQTVMDSVGQNIGTAFFGTEGIAEALPQTAKAAAPTSIVPMPKPSVPEAQATPMPAMPPADPTSITQPITDALNPLETSLDSVTEKLRTGLSTAIEEGGKAMLESIAGMEKGTLDLTNLVNENFIKSFSDLGGNIPKSIVNGVSANERTAYSAVSALSNNVLASIGAEIQGRKNGMEGMANSVGSVVRGVDVVRGFKPVSGEAMKQQQTTNNNRNILQGATVVNNNNADMEAFLQQINAMM